MVMRRHDTVLVQVIDPKEAKSSLEKFGVCEIEIVGDSIEIPLRYRSAIIKWMDDEWGTKEDIYDAYPELQEDLLEVDHFEACLNAIHLLQSDKTGYADAAWAVHWLSIVAKEQKVDEQREDKYIEENEGLQIELFPQLELSDVLCKAKDNLNRFFRGKDYEKLTEEETKELIAYREEAIFSWQETKWYDQITDFYTPFVYHAVDLAIDILGTIKEESK
jgi:hypothetical protein